MLEFERKFIDTIEADDWQVETDTGWSDIKAQEIIFIVIYIMILPVFI